MTERAVAPRYIPPGQRHVPSPAHPTAIMTHWVVGLAGLYLVLLFSAAVADLSGAATATGLIGFFGFPVAVSLLIVGGMWFYQAGQNADRLGAAGRRWAPIWGVLAWIIPLAHIVLPFLYTRELWQASDPKASANDWRERRLPGWFWLWWAAWGGAQLIGVAMLVVGIAIGIARAFETAASGVEAELGLPPWLQVLEVIRVGLIAVAYPFFIHLLYALRERQRERLLRRQALEAAGRAPWMRSVPDPLG